MTAPFITFEGGEGSGKTTQIQKLAAYLTEKKQKVFITREPGGCPGAEKIRDLLVKKNNFEWDAHTEYLLFAASRRTHISQAIRPHLNDGSWVLCDRFQDSSIAYQHFGHGLERPFMDHIYKGISGNLVPTLTFFLDVPPEVGLERAHGRQDDENRFEGFDLFFHRRVHQGYETLAKQDPQRIVTIDGTQSSEDVFRQILTALKEKLLGE